MTHYQIGQQPTRQGDVDSDLTLRDYWTVASNGAYKGAFDAGVLDGQNDLKGSVKTAYDALMAVEVSQRKEAWNARLDGYQFATIDNAGPIADRPNTPTRFVEAQPIVIKGKKQRSPGPFGGFRC